MEFFGDFGTGNSTPGMHWLPGMCTFLAVGTLVYHILGFRLLRQYLLGTYSQSSWWTYLKTYKGLLCRDVQSEIQYVSIVGCHHVIGGGLMAYSACMNAPSAWVAGALIGCFDDIHDTICMLLPAWPFGGGAERDMKFITIMLVHHTAAITATLPVICSGLYENQHIQSIGAWLLLAGGISHFTLAVSRTCNREVPSEAKFDALVWLCGGAFYTYSRLWCFPRSIMALFREEYAGLSGGMQTALIAFTVMMGVFNVLIFFDVMKNVLKRVRLVMNGSEKRS